MAARRRLRRCIRARPIMALRRPQRPAADAARSSRSAVPVADRIVETQAIAALRSGDRAADDLKRGAALARHHAVAAGHVFRRADPTRCSAPPNSMRRSAPGRTGLILGGGLVLGLLGLAFGLRSLSRAVPRPQSRRARRQDRAVRLRRRRRADDDRHRLLGAVRDRAVLRKGVADRLPVRPALEPADRDPRRSGRLVRRLRHRAAGHRHAADHDRSPC